MADARIVLVTSTPAVVPTPRAERPMESEQRGWNMGYLAGEAERLELATANVDLRSDLAAALRRIAHLEKALGGRLA